MGSRFGGNGEGYIECLEKATCSFLQGYAQYIPKRFFPQLIYFFVTKSNMTHCFILRNVECAGSE
jgi:hypothetical protein